MLAPPLQKASSTLAQPPLAPTLSKEKSSMGGALASQPLDKKGPSGTAPEEGLLALARAPSLVKAPSSLFPAPSAPDKDKQAKGPAADTSATNNTTTLASSSFLKPPKPTASTSVESHQLFAAGPPKIAT